MLQFLYKLYCLLFYKLVKGILRIDKVFADFGTMSMEWVMYRAFFAVFFIQMNWYFTSLKVIEILTHKKLPDYFNDPLISILVFMGIVSTFNYFLLIYKKRWFQYDEEFAAYSKTKNIIINIAIVLLYVFSVASYILVVEIWADLGHAGKIEGFKRY